MVGQAARLETTEDPFAHKLILAASGSDVAAEVIHGQEGHEVVLRGRPGKIIRSLSTESLDCQVVADRHSRRPDGPRQLAQIASASHRSRARKRLTVSPQTAGTLLPARIAGLRKHAKTRPFEATSPH